MRPKILIVKALTIILLMITIVSSGVFLPTNSAMAGMLEGIEGLRTKSEGDILQMKMGKGLGYITVLDNRGWFEKKTDMILEKARSVADYAWKKAGSQAFHKALHSSLNKIAIDSAKWLGSGKRGQKPMFIREDWGTYLANVGDNAAGIFLETLGEEGPTEFNLCKPSFGVTGSIGLGLVESETPEEPECSFSEMRDNWDKAINSTDFLSDFQDMFKPTSSDLGIALSLQTGMIEKKQKEKEEAKKKREENKGWLNLRNWAGEQKNIPGYAKMQAADVKDLQEGNFAEYTGDAFIDAANIFLNQLAITALNTALKNLGKNEPTYTNPYQGNYGGFEAQGGSNTKAVEDAKQRILETKKFSPGGEFEALGELTMCPNPKNAGPRECVINDNFRRAISEHLTVGEAMDKEYLNPKATFGYRSSESLEPRYNEGYPYRSMIILRKYRILPAGWELAAQYIKENFNDIGGAKNLAQMVQCFDENDDYEGYNADWCRRLVDPNWLLKVPATYCAKEGAGPKIVSENVIGKGEKSQYRINRDDSYCADEQTCIQEKNNSCKYFGYCTSDQREWNFKADQCDARYNTCQTFRSTDGAKVSYLENTLDYNGCNVGNAGCTAYVTSQGADYELETDMLNWASGSEKMYFDRDAEKCDKSKEGCHKFLRTFPGIGGNFLINSSFENNLTQGGWDSFGSAGSDSYYGDQALQLSSSLEKTINIGPADYEKKGKAYTLSFQAKDCSSGDEFEIMGQDSSEELSSGENWSYYRTSYIYPEDETDNVESFIIRSDSCVIDGLKLERGSQATNFADYGENGAIYEKLVPDYLEQTCYKSPGSDYRFKEDASDVCHNFLRKCNSSEAGCISYTSTKDDFQVVAKTIAQDRCPAECNGFDTYIQKATFFDTQKAEYFIPKTADRCNAGAVGCDQFTNLDKIGKGAEAIENYSYLRQCVKPGGPSECVEYYTWQGGEQETKQLVYFTLQRDTADIDSDGVIKEPAVTSDDNLKCSKDIYELPTSDPEFNPDCRKFYNQEGEISYHSYSKTITCSQNCHPYRRTIRNVAPELDSSSLCSSSGSGYVGTKDNQFHWDLENQSCYFCKNNGHWSAQHNACIYKAIPNQSIACSANQAGCREYNGNQGNNMRIVADYNFETGDEQRWAGGEISQTAINDGTHSFKIPAGTASTSLGLFVHQGSSYTLKFLAKKSSDDVTLNISFNNGKSQAKFSQVAIDSDSWMVYEASLSDLNHKVSYSEELVIQATGGDVYVDDLRLTEIQDRYYLIKNSWTTPDSCNQDIYGNPHPLYMLGCEQYKDKEGGLHYLHSFEELCQDSASNCELMLDTHNSSDPKKSHIKGVTTPADNYVYMTYDAEKQCVQGEKGCQRFGKIYTYNQDKIYTNTYLKNNPDRYNSILCSSSNVDCQEWVTVEEDVNVYFKDPGEKVCKWRKENSSWDWYEKQIKRCDHDDSLCLTQADCSIGGQCEIDKDCSEGNKCINSVCCSACVQEDTDTRCQTEKTTGIRPKTLGEGGKRIKQPEKNWVGLCPSSQSGCTEYIDPESKFLPNLFDTRYSQPTAELTPYTAYVDINNNLREQDIPGVGGDVKYYYGDTPRSVTGGSSDVLRKAIVDYRVENKVNKTDCTEENYGSGCVWFNERKITSGENYTTTSNGYKGGANQLLKVQPDRSCSEWLACTTYTKDEEGKNVCFDVGRCNSLDDNGNCDNFLAGNQNREMTKTNYLKNPGLSGYSKLSYKDNGSYYKVPNDLYSLESMDQVGQTTRVANGDFEFYGGNNYPIGWIPYNASWDTNMFTVVDNPITAQVEGVDYPAHGRAFLKYTAENNDKSPYSEDILVDRGKKYILTAKINTLNLKEDDGGPAGAEIEIEGGNQSIRTAKAQKWRTVLKEFTAQKGKLKLHLKSYGNKPQGNIYIDNIKIMPALQVNNDWKVAQTCRLYPKTDSLTCEYYEESGKKQKGKYGYCLEYDRYPGNSNACLLWWPVDMVKGQGIEEGAGYKGKFPLYYTSRHKAERVYEYRQVFFRAHCEDPCDVTCPDGYNVIHKEDWGGFLGTHCTHDYYCDPSGDVVEDTETETISVSGEDTSYTSDTNGWYEYNGRANLTNYADKLPDADKHSQTDLLCSNGYNCNSSNKLTYEPYRSRLYVDKITQTVTPMGANKYWSKRVYKGSDFSFPGLGIEYNTRDVPFGSLISPASSLYQVLDPYSWSKIVHTEDNLDNNDIGAVYHCEPHNNCRFVIPDYESSNFPFEFIDKRGDNSDLIKRLFAQSYDSWKWDGNHYTKISGTLWDPPTDLCNGTGLPPRPDVNLATDVDYCAISPRVDNNYNNSDGNNIKVNGEIRDIEINVSNFINLTFNSVIDSQQLPLVMYAVDWSDGNKSVISGVEMRDRPGERVHSLYHLYNYWDLQGKDDNEDSITCGTDDQQRDYCTVVPKVKLKDNWDWCNGPENNATELSGRNDCDNWVSFEGSIRVYK